MQLFEDTAEDEIRRLRRIIDKLETEKGTQMVTVEIVHRENPVGYLFYITAPTVMDEAVFARAMAETITRAFRKIDVKMEGPDILGEEYAAPPKRMQ